MYCPRWADACDSYGWWVLMTRVPDDGLWARRMEKERWLYKSWKKKKGSLFDLRAKEKEGKGVVWYKSGDGKVDGRLKVQKWERGKWTKGTDDRDQRCLATSIHFTYIWYGPPQRLTAYVTSPISPSPSFSPLLCLLTYSKRRRTTLLLFELWQARERTALLFIVVVVVVVVVCPFVSSPPCLSIPCIIPFNCWGLAFVKDNTKSHASDTGAHG